MILKLRRFLQYLLPFILFATCTNSALFDEVTALPTTGWHYQDQVEFTIPVSDTHTVYNVLMHVRNTKKYEYSNLWLFVTTHAPNGDEQRDTLEIILADQAGHWAGKGTRSVNAMLVSYLNEVKFPHRGVYTMEVQHAMRDTLLQSIMDIGIRIESHK